MFLRKNRKRFDGVAYEYWTLCETLRTERGPRQRVVASLGKLTEEDIEGGWEDLEALLDGRRPKPRQLELGEAGCGEKAGLGWELADLSNLRVEWAREFGSVFLALALWRSLESWMNAKGLGSRAAKLLEALSTIRSMDGVVPVKRAAGAIELRLRTLAKPDEDVAVLLAHLGLKLPKGSKLAQNVVEKNH